MSFLWRLFTHSKRINDYFANAVRVYALTGDEHTRCAALNAAKVATRKQRSRMIAYLLAMAFDIEHAMGDGSGAKLPIQRLLTLKKDIEAKDWNVIDAAREKDRLSELEPEYLEALNRVDPSVFERKHPELFRRHRASIKTNQTTSPHGF
jgi:hypothetical protein